MFYNIISSRMKTILKWISVIVVAVAFFCIGIIFIPMEKQIVWKMELTYIFVDQYWNEYDIFAPVHGAATDWSFLFDDNKSVEQNPIVNVNANNMDDESPTKTDYLMDVVDHEVDEEENLEEKKWLEERKLEEKRLEEERLEETLDGTNTGLDNTELDIDVWGAEIKEWNVDGLVKGLDEIRKDVEKDQKTCVTPWKTVLKHGESVIAYEQRKDVPTICNAQRRTCNNGVLNWTYLQWACDEGVEYKYTKVKVISYNTKTPGELIQNPKYAKYDWAEFDTRGKINPDTKIPYTDWDNYVKDWPIKDPNINSWGKNKMHYNCVSPWGDSIQHWQFIRAYKSPIWFTDELCQVELRLCLDWNLNWSFVNKSCEYVWVSSQDYREWNVDVTKPSQELLDEVSQKDPNRKWFRGRLKGRFG